MNKKDYGFFGLLKEVSLNQVLGDVDIAGDDVFAIATPTPVGIPSPLGPGVSPGIAPSPGVLPSPLTPGVAVPSPGVLPLPASKS